MHLFRISVSVSEEPFASVFSSEFAEDLVPRLLEDVNVLDREGRKAYNSQQRRIRLLRQRLAGKHRL